MSHSLVQILVPSLLVPLQLATVVQRHVQPVNHKLLQATIVLHGQSVKRYVVIAQTGRLGIDAQDDDLRDRLVNLVVALDLIMGDLQAGTGGGKGQGGLVDNYKARCQACHETAHLAYQGS